MSDDPLHPSKHRPPSDARLAEAIDCIDRGDVARLGEILDADLSLVTARVEDDWPPFQMYFARPTLLHFVAENPIRTGKIAPNIAELIGLLIDRGADVDAICGDGGTTLGLVASGCVARECGMQGDMIRALVERGADPSKALAAAVGQKEDEAAAMLLELGATPDLAGAAGLGELEHLRRHLTESPTESERRWALKLACLRNQPDAIDLLLESGLDVNAEFEPFGTPLHIAALENNLAAVARLLQYKPDLSARDRQHGGTPADFAEHAGHEQLANLLRKFKQAGYSAAHDLLSANGDGSAVETALTKLTP